MNKKRLTVLCSKFLFIVTYIVFFSVFQVHTSSEQFINALKMLNDTLDEKNLEALRKIGEMSDNPCISEDQIILGVGLHLIHKLTGNSVTDPATNDVECPCGCPGILPSSSNMWIGK